MESISDETRTLRRTMRDLVALSALPAVWSGYRRLQVAEGLADVLLRALRLDLVYIHLLGQAEGKEIEVARAAGGSIPTDQTRDIGRALAPWLAAAGVDSAPPILPNPVGPGTLRVVALSVGCGPQDGVLVAGSRRTAFPSEEDGLLLSVGANQAAAVLRREQDEEALRESNERFRIVTKATNDAVWDWDLRTNKVWWNEGVLTLFGYLLEKNEADADWWLQRIHPDDREAVEAFFFEVVRGKERSWVDEYRFRCADGSYKDVYDRGYVLRDSAGRAVRMIGAMLDITERKHAEEALRASEQRFRTFVDHATDAFFLQDDQGVILDVNRQACESLGYTREDLVGKTPPDFDPDATPALLEKLAASLNAGEPVAFESRHRRKDGTVFPVDIRGRAFWEGGRRFLVSLARDISDRKHDEALLDGQKRILELIIQGEPLPHVLTVLCRAIEELAQGEMLASVLLLDPDGIHLRHGAAPSLPESYNRAVDGLPIGPSVGSCGTAAYRREPVYVSDIASDPLWAPFAEFALSHGLRACWSTPILSSHAEVLGTFAMYYRQPRRPTPRDLRAVDIVTRTVAIAIEQSRAEQELRESEERFRGTFENAGVGIAHTHPTGRLLRVNEKFCAIVGYPRAELLQKTFQDITHPDDLTASVGSLAALMRGESAVMGHEKRYVRKDGSPVWVELFSSLQRDAAGQPTYAIAVIQDISERRRLDAELRRAKEAAEAANRAKDEFLANVSHEIRTPMNAILGMTELVLDTSLAGDQRQSLKTVKSAADNLLGIINDLLDFSKIEAGKLELDSADFSLRTAVGDTLRALAVRAHKKGLELIYHVQPELSDALVGDAGRLRQVLLNLVGNAIKFTDEGEVVVRVEAAGSEVRSQRSEVREEGAGVLTSDLCPLTSLPGEVGLRFTVRDTGIGIPPDKQGTIFRAFEQEDTSTTRKYGGTGLGLTIAARLVALMGGQISVDSTPGRGSVFAFTARFGLQPHPAEPAAAQPPVLLRNLPVLIVDDNATNRHILKEWLRGWQMEAEAVGDAAAAMDALWHRAANGRPYALVLLDARMPDRDGLTVAAMIRERTELSTTRLILLTSGDRPGDPTRFHQLRIDAHQLKPVQQEELLETIYQVMSRPTGNGSTTVRPAPAREPATASVPVAPPLHILVAEDNEFSARLMDQLLARRGHRVRLATNGPEALTLAKEGAFDLLLLDIHMPGLDGFKVVGAIREREQAAGGHLPVIALTARSRKEDRERCLAAGMDDFLTKPVSSAALFAAIDRLVYAYRVSLPSQANAGKRGSLLDPVAVLTSCGDNAEGLRRMCQDFQTYAPVRLAEVSDALRDRDALRLRQAAHKFCALLFAFSTVAGNVASDLEDHAARGQLEEAQPLAKQLDKMTRELVQLAGNLSLEALRQQAEVSDDRQSTGQPIRQQAGDL